MMNKFNKYTDVEKIFNNIELYNQLLSSKNISWQFNKKELGDYQTPISLVKKVINVLKINGVELINIIEPTMGKGNFIIELFNNIDGFESVFGIEKQEEYLLEFAVELKKNFKKEKYDKLKIYNDDIFSINIENLITEGVVIIGNPPWVTNSNQSVLKSQNIPQKSNFRLLKGMDAITGKSNFDISEAIIIKLIQSLIKVKKGYVSLLVKNIVIRNLLYYCENLDCKIKDFKMYKFDAKKEFGVNTSASLLFISVDNEIKNNEITSICEIYDIDQPDILIDEFGWVNNNFVSSIKNYEYGKVIEKVDRVSTDKLVWRSGIKHDASKIMEVEYKGDDKYYNKFSDINFEKEPLIYPYLKSSDIGKINNFFSIRKGVIITQKKVGETTDYIKTKYPNIWSHLEKNSEKLDKRGSSIYKNKPRFSIFGVGDYCFKNYKVAISGMYKKSKFSFISPVDNKPVLFDDTVYFLSFEEKSNALIALALLNSQLVQSFINAIAFVDNKRPYTKDILMRIDLEKALENSSLKKINKYLKEEKFKEVTKDELKCFRQLIKTD